MLQTKCYSRVTLEFICVMPGFRESQPYPFSSATKESWGKFFENFVDGQSPSAGFLWSLFATICDSFHLPFLSAHAVPSAPGSLQLGSRALFAHILARSPSVLTEASSPVGLSGGGPPALIHRVSG